MTCKGTSVAENKLLSPFQNASISKITPLGFRFSENAIIKKPCAVQQGGKKEGKNI